jgi:hypothetical protein
MTDLCEARPPRAPIERTDRLYVPHRKRLSRSYSINDEGVRELRIDYGIKEVSFDEERLFAFGEQLVSLPSFTAEEATQWGPGYEWDEVQPLLEALREEGILKCGEPSDDHRGGGLVPSPLPPSSCPVARTWSVQECESITRDLGKRAVELGALEAVVPVYRIAHAALDADDRQVGEANVYPPTLRLDRDTEWRVCQYSGSRYQDDSPMNITALKAMIKHWKPMMAALLAVRDALKPRLGIVDEKWSIGNLHTLSCAVLALPAYQLMKGGGQSPQPLLHPVLSSLFRITDGIRMTMYEMQFSLAQQPRQADELTTAAEIYAYAEQQGVFISPTGVCAGPRPLIEEFLVTAVDGVPAQGISGLQHSAEVKALLDELPNVIDYSLLGLKVWGLTQSVWLEMSKACFQLLGLLERVPHRSATAERLVEKLRADWVKLERMQIAEDFDREVHARAYADAYERSHRTLPTQLATGPALLAEALIPAEEGAAHRAAEQELAGMLGTRLGVDRGVAERAASIITRYLRVEQGVSARVTELQHQINQLLARPGAKREITARDFLVFYTMNGSVFPYLLDALERAAQIRIDCSAVAIEMSELGGSAEPTERAAEGDGRDRRAG